MDDVPRWLIIPLGVLVIACWIGGAWVVFGATRHRGRLPKILWRGAVVAFPVTAFLRFALCDRSADRVPQKSVRRGNGSQSISW